MSRCPISEPEVSKRRSLVTACAVSFVLLALTATPAPAASGVVTTFTSQPASTAAGGDPSITTNVAFSYGDPNDTVKNLTMTLPPGLLAATASVPQTCSPAQLAASTCPNASKIAATTATTNAGPATSSLFLMPAPSSNDVAGVGQTIYFGGAAVAATTGVIDLAIVGGQPVGVLKITLPNMVGAFSVTLQSVQLTIFGTTSNGLPFTRLPTNCATATTTLSVDTYSASGDGSGSDSFTPTGCSGLAYAPTLTASAVRDSGDAGVRLTTVITQPAGQAGNKSATISIPTAVIQPNGPGDAAVLCSDASLSSCPQVGSAVASSPLLPGTLAGKVYLLGSLAGPTFVVAFPPPVALTLRGAINLQNGTVSYSNLPDVPISSLSVVINGGPKAVLQSSCAVKAGAVMGAFTGQNGLSANSSSTLHLTGCPGTGPVSQPQASSGSLSGVAGGKAKLTFHLDAGAKAAQIRSFTVTLPNGLSFDSKRLLKGISIRGAGSYTAKLKHGALVVALKATARGVSVTLSSTSLKVSKVLAKNVKQHKTKALTVSIGVTDAHGKTTTIRLALKV